MQLREAEPAQGGVSLAVRLPDGSADKFWLPAEWIRDNATCHAHAANQITLRLEDLAAPSPLAVRTCSVVQEGGAGVPATLHAVLENGAEYTVVPAKLHGHGMQLRPLPNPTPLMGGASAVKHVPFEEAVHVPRAGEGSLKGRGDLMRALVVDGICVVDGCPVEDESVLRLCRSLAPATGEQKTLYGSSFKVDSAPRGAAAGAEVQAAGGGDAAAPRNNLAYTGKFLDLHNDLPWYESMPGLQLLHCQRFDDAVTGGETYFVDAFGAAAELRKQDPAAFAILTKVPVVFTREDDRRSVPARYYTAVPYISLDHAGGMRKVVWSLQNEGPMPLSLGQEVLTQFYAARKAFAAVLLKWRTEHIISVKLRPGQCVVWNQVRLLHGRMAFEEPVPGMRRLHGAYCNIDDWASEVRQVLIYGGKTAVVEGGDDDERTARAARFCNGSWV